MHEPPAEVPDNRSRGAQRLVQIFVSLAGAEFLTRGFQLVAALIVVRALSPGEFGQFTFAFALASIVNFVLDFGVTALVVRDVSAEPHRAPHLLGAFLWVQTLLAVGVFAITAGLAVLGVFGSAASVGAIVIALAAVAIGSISRPFEATLTGQGKAQLVTVGRVIRGLALVAATVLVAIDEPGVSAFLAALLVGELVGSLTIAAICILRSTRPKLGHGLSEVAKLALTAVPFGVLSGFSVLYLRVDILMLGALSTDVAVGNYGVASRIVETAIIIPAFFGSAFLATVAQTGPRTARARMQTIGALRHILLICLPLALVLAVVATPLVDLVAGADYESAGHLLTLLSPWLVLIAGYSVLVNLEVALDRIKVLIAIIAAGVALKIALNLYSIPEWGANGAAITALAAEVFVVVAQWFNARRYVDVRAFLRYLPRLLGAGAGMLAVTLALSGPVGWVIASIAGLVVFGGLAIVLRAVTVDEYRLALSAVGVGGRAR